MLHRKRRIAILVSAMLSLLFLPACQDGHLNVLGYTTRPNYDTSIKTVRLNIFENRTFYRGLEFELQEALVRDIEKITPYKVVGIGCNADTEISGTIVTYNKNILNRTQQNETREAETVLTVELVWKDLRTGELLSSPARGMTNPPVIPPIMPGIGMPSAATVLPPEVLPPAMPVGP